MLLFIRKTRIHPSLVQEFLDFVYQIILASELMMEAAEELENLVRVSFKRRPGRTDSGACEWFGQGGMERRPDAEEAEPAHLSTGR